MSRTVLITGAARRVGRDIALFLASLGGYNLALHYHSSEEQAQDLLQEISAKGVKARIYKADLRQVDECRSLLKAVKNDFADLSVLVNSASIFKRLDFLQVEEGDLLENMQVNLFAPFFLTQSFAKLGCKGHVINITDTKITTNLPVFFPYLLSKKSFSSFSDMSALRLAPDIKINEICLGSILYDKEISDQPRDDINEKLPGKKHASLADLRRTIKFILESNSYYGQKFFLDSGSNLV